MRDKALKAEIFKVHKNQLLGSGGPQDARDAGPPLRSPSVMVPVMWPGAPPVRLMADLGLPRRQTHQVAQNDAFGV